MGKMNPQDEGARQIVKKFCNYVVQLKAIHHIYKELFDDDEAIRLMEQTAKAFFLDINRIIVNYFLLEIAKITDPATSKYNKQENFTVANIIQSIDWPRNVIDELRRLNDFVNDFRRYVVDVRNKVLAHYDKDVLLSNAVLGGFPEGQDEKLINTLEKMANALHEACFGHIFGEIIVTMPGDVLDLKKALKRGLAFDKLFMESKGDDLMRLDKYLEEAL